MDIVTYLKEVWSYWAPGAPFSELSGDSLKYLLDKYESLYGDDYGLSPASACIHASAPVKRFMNVAPPTRFENKAPATESSRDAGGGSSIMECLEAPCLCDTESNDVLNRFGHDEEEDLTSTDLINELDEERIKKEIIDRLNRLRKLGITELELSELLASSVRISPIRVTRDGRILLTDYDNKEVEMGLIEKTLYLLFLRHPEGFYQKDLIDYSGELQDLYRKVNGGTITPRGMQGIGRLINPLDNSCDEKISHIRRTFASLFQPRIAEQYSITRGKGEIRRIPLEASMITWE